MQHPKIMQKYLNLNRFSICIKYASKYAKEFANLCKSGMALKVDTIYKKNVQSVIVTRDIQQISSGYAKTCNKNPKIVEYAYLILLVC